MLIADDALHYFKRNSALAYLCTRYRHVGINYFIVCTQHFRALDPKVRSNASSMIIMKQVNLKQIQAMEEELDGLLNGQFMKLTCTASTTSHFPSCTLI